MSDMSHSYTWTLKKLTKWLFWLLCTSTSGHNFDEKNWMSANPIPCSQPCKFSWPTFSTFKVPHANCKCSLYFNAFDKIFRSTLVHSYGKTNASNIHTKKNHTKWSISFNQDKIRLDSPCYMCLSFCEQIVRFCARNYLFRQFSVKFCRAKNILKVVENV